MPDVSSAEGAPLSLWNRLAAQWRFKLVLNMVVGTGFWMGYLWFSRHSLRPVQSLPLTALDRWVGFQPQPWVWVYESCFLITGVVPWLATTRGALLRYATGFALLAGVSFLVFACFPVASPRPPEWHDAMGSGAFTSWDGPLNAFPSLHAGTLVYSLAFLRRVSGQSLGRWAWAALFAWGGAILFATLATKQHYAVDLLAGALLGWGADWLCWRQRGSGDITAESKRRNRGPMSHDGCI